MSGGVGKATSGSAGRTSSPKRTSGLKRTSDSKKKSVREEKTNEGGLSRTKWGQGAVGRHPAFRKSINEREKHPIPHEKLPAQPDSSAYGPLTDLSLPRVPPPPIVPEGKVPSLPKKMAPPPQSPLKRRESIATVVENENAWWQKDLSTKPQEENTPIVKDDPRKAKDSKAPEKKKTKSFVKRLWTRITGKGSKKSTKAKAPVQESVSIAKDIPARKDSSAQSPSIQAPQRPPSSEIPKIQLTGNLSKDLENVKTVKDLVLLILRYPDIFDHKDKDTIKTIKALNRQDREKILSLVRTPEFRGLMYEAKFLDSFEHNPANRLQAATLYNTSLGLFQMVNASLDFPIAHSLTDEQLCDYAGVSRVAYDKAKEIKDGKVKDGSVLDKDQITMLSKIAEFRKQRVGYIRETSENTGRDVGFTLARASTDRDASMELLRDILERA